MANSGMGCRVRPLSGLIAAVALAACQPEDTGPAAENVLTLRLGGNYGSLREDLRRSAPQPKPVRPQPTKPPAPQPEPKPTPDPTPPKPQVRTVRLASGQTLYGLCRTHLGDGNRWREVARLNGWSADEAQRLPVGQTVKLPPARLP